MNECILQAFAAGRPAELVITFATIEGDPITNYVRVLDAGRVELFTDTTRDSYGSQGWVHSSCTDLDEAEDGQLIWGECVDLPLDEPVEVGPAR
jgi:hypothetical protein